MMHEKGEAEKVFANSLIALEAKVFTNGFLLGTVIFNNFPLLYYSMCVFLRGVYLD